MEGKANYLLVGIFVVASGAILIATLAWLFQADFDGDRTEYEILIGGSVSGLSVAAEVRFNGIPVGQVKSINIYQPDPRQVQVIVTIDQSVPITVDAVATLAVQGLTGLSVVEITGGSENVALARNEGQEYRRIRSEPSTIQGLLADVPVALDGIRAAAETVAGALNSDNQELINHLLKNLVIITDDIAGVSAETSANFQAASRTLVDVSSQADRLLNLVGAFSVGTLPEVSLLVTDLRQLTAKLDSFATDLDQNPSETIFGTRLPEYEVD